AAAHSGGRESHSGAGAFRIAVGRPGRSLAGGFPVHTFPAAVAATSERDSGGCTGHTRYAAQLTISLTLAVPTHNRAATLAETLASLAAQSLPAGVETECIVVDNNSTDRTP